MLAKLNVFPVNSIDVEQSPKPTAYTEFESPDAFVVFAGTSFPDANGMKILAEPDGLDGPCRSGRAVNIYTTQETPVIIKVF